MLVPNAWVTEFGPVIGGGRRRIMSLGLPYLQGMSHEQLKAVLCHELGHFGGGDAALGGWLYGARALMIRAVLALRGSPLNLLFYGYALLFIRVTSAISRSQERSADALAVRIAGPRAAADALRHSQGLADANGPYWSSELAPILEAGFLPPIAEGFGVFIKAPLVAEVVENATLHEAREGRGSPYDSHPPLHERFEAIGRLTLQSPGPAPPAIELLDTLPDLERRVMATAFGEARVRSLTRIGWDEVVARVRLPRWRAEAAKRTQLLGAWTGAMLPPTGAALEDLSARMASKGQKDAAEALLGAALLVALESRGWHVVAPPGHPVVCEKDGAQLEPFAIAREAAGPHAEAWAIACREHDLASLSLAPGAELAATWAAVPRAALAPAPTRAPRRFTRELVAAAIVGVVASAGVVRLARTTPEQECAATPLRCFDLALAFEQGQGGTPDVERALSLYRLGCERSVAPACYNVGLLELGKGKVARDPQAAFSHLTHGCSLGLGQSCAALVELYQDCSRPVDLAQAASLYQRACQLGDRDACDEAPRAQQLATERTSEALHAACDSGVGNGCADLGYLYECGAPGVTPNREQARELYRRACDFRDGEGCRLLQKLEGGGT
jgi:hypothetical protein